MRWVCSLLFCIGWAWSVDSLFAEDIGAGTEPLNRQLIEAIGARDPSKVQNVLQDFSKEGVDVNKASYTDPITHSCWSALALSTENSSPIEVIRGLLDAGADPNARVEQEGVESPASFLNGFRHRTTHMGYRVMRLWAGHSHLTWRTDQLIPPYINRETMLMMAVKNVRPQVVHELLERGARVSDVNTMGNTALKYALSIPLVPVGWKNREISEDILSIVRDLMAHGADINRVLYVMVGSRRIMVSPLMLAVSYSSASVVEELLKSGADVNAVMDGESAWTYARARRLQFASLSEDLSILEQESAHIQNLLLDYGANVGRILPSNGAIRRYVWGVRDQDLAPASSEARTTSSENGLMLRLRQAQPRVQQMYQSVQAPLQNLSDRVGPTLRDGVQRARQAATSVRERSWNPLRRSRELQQAATAAAPESSETQSTEVATRQDQRRSWRESVSDFWSGLLFWRSGSVEAQAKANKENQDLGEHFGASVMEAIQEDRGTQTEGETTQAVLTATEAAQPSARAGGTTTTFGQALDEALADRGTDENERPNTTDTPLAAESRSMERPTATDEIATPLDTNLSSDVVSGRPEDAQGTRPPPEQS